MRPNLGIDGVLLRAVNEKQIDGEGEYDPPNGWRKFTVIWDADAIA